MGKDHCEQDDFNSLINGCRFYLKNMNVEDGNLNKISRKKSGRNNILFHKVSANDTLTVKNVKNILI